MIPFAAKLRSGDQILGLGLSTNEILTLKSGGHVEVDLGSVGVGLWIKEADGSRRFIQPRDSKVVVIAGDSAEDVGAFLRVDLP